MQQKTIPVFETQFEEEVYQGLTTYPKQLSSKYFYDAKGDLLFQEIMRMPEYYLTNCEFQILETHKAQIGKLFADGVEKFNLIELGAGDGKKTKILLKHLVSQNKNFSYLPIDISQNVLNQLESSIHKEIPEVKIETLQGTYFETLKNIDALKGVRNIILFLGSNIGNLLHEQAIKFLKNIKDSMQDGDILFMGFDQKKNPQTILNAYNDATGITEAFNKNVLTRINNELGGNFKLDLFIHWEVYDPETGTAKSYLVANQQHSVVIEKLGIEVHFKAWETIHTEISQKYDDAVVAWLADEAGLQIETEFEDEQKYYKNYVFRKK